jgi:hypothetical protein
MPEHRPNAALDMLGTDWEPPAPAWARPSTHLPQIEPNYPDDVSDERYDPPPPPLLARVDHT